MTKKKPEAAIYEPTALVANDGKEYAIDYVRELFINSDKSVEDLAVQLNMPVEVVEAQARKGLRSWYKLKQDKLETRMQYFLDVNIDNLMETHSILEDGHLLQIIQMKGTQDFLKAYYAKNGHLFMIKEDGEIATDAYGMPIPLPLPTGPKQLLALDGLLKLKDGTKREMNHIYEAAKEAKKNAQVNVESYDIFDSKDD